MYYLSVGLNTHSVMSEYRYLFWVFSLACPTNLGESFDLPLLNCTSRKAYFHVSATRNLFTIHLFSLLSPNICLLIYNTQVKLAKSPINISLSVRVQRVY